jgi:hypothetical protein
MASADLDALVARELWALPRPPAPETLLPRILAAARAWQMRPWYAREWLAWPLGWQLVSAAAFVALTIGVAVFLKDFPPVEWPTLSEAADRVGWKRLEGAVVLGRSVWEALVRPFIPYAFALAALMCAACAACCTALNHLVTGKAFSR